MKELLKKYKKMLAGDEYMMKKYANKVTEVAETPFGECETTVEIDTHVYFAEMQLLREIIRDLTLKIEEEKQQAKANKPKKGKATKIV
jgi:hypothetical protein